MKNIRSKLEFEDGYEAINREERNVAAILYHALLLPGNLERFLELIGCDHELRRDEVGIFFEYAYLRDLWHHRVRSPEVGRELILECLSPPEELGLRSCSIEAFNTLFGAVPRASSTNIQSPGNWSISRFAANIDDDQLFLAVCRFKWAFNAKPDVVVHTSRSSAVCIEAKYASGEGSYPAQSTEKDEFKRRGLEAAGRLVGVRDLRMPRPVAGF